ncbi:hypothetical protein ACFX4W_26705 [Priestia sp. YIM B13489]
MNKFGPKALVTPGLVLVILSLVLFSQLSTSTSAAYVVALQLVFRWCCCLHRLPGYISSLSSCIPMAQQ